MRTRERSSAESTHPPDEHSLPPEQGHRPTRGKERAKREWILAAAPACRQEHGPKGAAEDDRDKQRDQQCLPTQEGAEHRAELEIAAAHTAAAHQDDHQKEAATEKDAEDGVEPRDAAARQVD